MEDLEKISLIRKFLEGSLNKNSVEENAKILASNVTLHGPDWGRQELGRERLIDLDYSLAKAFTKKLLSIHDLYAHGDKVIVEWEYTVTHSGELTTLVDPPIPPTGEEITISGISIYRFQEEKVCEIWQGWDLKGLVFHLRQIAEIDTFAFLATEKKEYYLEGASKLSAQERLCLRHLLFGNTAQETATAMKISPRTVESYLESAKIKLNCDHKRELFKAITFLDRLRLWTD